MPRINLSKRELLRELLEATNRLNESTRRCLIVGAELLRENPGNHVFYDGTIPTEARKFMERMNRARGNRDDVVTGVMERLQRVPWYRRAWRWLTTYTGVMPVRVATVTVTKPPAAYEPKTPIGPCGKSVQCARRDDSPASPCSVCNFAGGDHVAVEQAVK